MRVLLFLFCLWTRPSLGMNATEFFKGAAATEDHLLWNQPTNWLLRLNQVRSPDSGQGLGCWCWIACLSAAKPIWPPARQSLVISLSAKKMGQKIWPKKTILARPSESDIGGWLCSHQCGNEEKKLGKVHQMMICQDGHATFGRISHPSLPDRHSISVLPWHCDEIHLVPHHGSHWSVLREGVK